MAIFTIASKGTLGDHFPFLALGEALVAQGHTVRYPGPAHLAGAISECGMEAWPFRCDLEPENVRANPDAFDHWRPERGGPVSNRTTESIDMFARGRYGEKLEDLLEAADGSDFLICSRLLPLGRTVAECAGIPWATVCVVPWFYPSPGTAAARGIEARENADHPGMRGFISKLNAWRVSRGLAALTGPTERELFEARRILLATSPLFGQPQAADEREMVQTGFWLHTPPAWRKQGLPGEGAAWLDACAEPPVVLSFSSQPVRDPGGLLDLHLEAARLIGRNLVVQGGWAAWDSPAFAAACVEGRAFRLPAGPQDGLFQRAGVVVHHGGIGTTARAMLAGVPQLVEPHGNDQFYNARQVVALGAGAAVNPHRMTAGGLAEVLGREVLTKEKSARAGALADLLAAEPGVTQGVCQLERWLVARGGG